MSATRSSSLCTFTFSDGRRCRTPRQPSHPLFCSFHARKFEQSQTADRLGREIAVVFSRDYLSACDLNAALARLFTATARGHVSPKTTRTLAYLAQVMVQNLRLAEHEYINAFSTDGWRRSVRSSVHSNSDSLDPRTVVAGLQPGPSPFPSPAPQPGSQPPITSSNPPRPTPSSASTIKSQFKRLLASELALPAKTPPQPPVALSPAPISKELSSNLTLSSRHKDQPRPRKRQPPILPTTTKPLPTMTIPMTTSRVSFSIPPCAGASGAHASSAFRRSACNPCRINTSAATPYLLIPKDLCSC